MKSLQIKKIIQKIGDFPTLPSVVARVIQVLDNPHSSASNLTDILSLDQAMMSRILKMANSAYYGFPRAISTVTESIVVLGFMTVRNLILTTMIYNFDQMCLPRGRPVSGLEAVPDQRLEWKHAVATAVAARELLIRQNRKSLEHMGYLAGLMHDIGKKMFHYYLWDEYQPVLEAERKAPRPLSEYEAEIMGAHHGEVGAWIVDYWNLPLDIVTPIACHHYPDMAKENTELTRVLHAADWLGHAALEPDSTELAAPPQLKLLEMDPEAMPKLMRQINEELLQIQTFMEA